MDDSKINLIIPKSLDVGDRKVKHFVELINKLEQYESNTFEKRLGSESSRNNSLIPAQEEDLIEATINETVSLVHRYFDKNNIYGHCTAGFGPTLRLHFYESDQKLGKNEYKEIEFVLNHYLLEYSKNGLLVLLNTAITSILNWDFFYWERRSVIDWVNRNYENFARKIFWLKKDIKNW